MTDEIAVNEVVPGGDPDIAGAQAAGSGGAAAEVRPAEKAAKAGSAAESEDVQLKSGSADLMARGRTLDAGVDPILDLTGQAQNLKLVMDVELNVTLRFGQRVLSLREVLELSSGSVIELDRQVDEPVELLLDGRVIARGEAVVIDGYYGLRVTEVPRLEASAPRTRAGVAR